MDRYYYDFLVDERRKAYAKARKQLLKQKERANETRGTRKPGRRGKKQRKIRLTTALRIRSPHSTRGESVSTGSRKKRYPKAESESVVKLAIREIEKR